MIHSYKYSDKWTKIGVNIEICLGNSHNNFQLHMFTISENIAKSFRRATFFDSHCTFETETEQGLTSHQTHYRSYRGRIFTSQMTQPTVSKH